MAEFLKSQSPQELWKAALKPKDPFNPDSAKPSDTAMPLQAAKQPGTGVMVDVSA